MSCIQYLLDLNRSPIRLDDSGSTPVKLPDDFSGPCVVITDYQASPFGVETLPAQHDNLAPLLEKRLRDQGDIDELAQVLIHAKEQQNGLARACYSAVPVSTHLRYRNWCAQHDDHVLLFPLPEALLALSRQQALHDGMLIFVHGQSIDLLVFQDDKVLAANRMHLFSHDSSEYQRLARQISSSTLQLNSAPANTPCLLVEATAGECAPLQNALFALQLALNAPVLPAVQLFRALKPKQADVTSASRFMYIAHLALPVVGVFMLVLCLASAGLTWYWKQQAENYQQALTAFSHSNSVAAPGPALESALREANLLVQSQGELQAFLDITERASKTPAPAQLVQNLRLAATKNIELTEVSILSDKRETLIIVVGRSGGIAAPLEAETRFVNALNKQGYTVVKREIESEAGKSLFRLALIWSAK